MWPATKVSVVAARGARLLGSQDDGGGSASTSASQVTGISGPFFVGRIKTVRFFTIGRRWPSCLCLAVACFKSLCTGSGHSALTERLAGPPAPNIDWQSRSLRPGVLRRISSRAAGHARVKTSALSRVARAGAVCGSVAGEPRSSARAGGLQACQLVTNCTRCLELESGEKSGRERHRPELNSRRDASDDQLTRVFK